MKFQQYRHGARSLPYKGPYVAAMVVTFIHYLSVVSAITLGALLFCDDTEQNVAIWAIIALAAVGVTWGFGFIFRRSAKCPLCKGTPLLDTRAAKHVKAVRFKPLNFGASALFELTFTQRFRCMHCGTPYDLHRKSHIQKGEPASKG